MIRSTKYCASGKELSKIKPPIPTRTTVQTVRSKSPSVLGNIPSNRPALSVGFGTAALGRRLATPRASYWPHSSQDFARQSALTKPTGPFQMSSSRRGCRCARSLALDAVGLLRIAVAILLGGLVALVGLLLVWSYPGRPRPLVDEAGEPLPRSISAKIFVTINGVRQGMFIKSKDGRNPVLLYLHGEMPDYFLSQKFPTGLDDHFTVVWWLFIIEGVVGV
jgi:hypothetical protein